MKQLSRTILGIAVLYTALVAVLDFSLTGIPIINWLALTLTFLFFTALILDTVMKLRVKEPQTHIQGSEGRRDDLDELDRLERNLERALVERQPESLKILDERLKSLALKAFASRTRQSATSLMAPAENEKISEIFEECSISPQDADPPKVEKVLTKIEDWLI